MQAEISKQNTCLSSTLAAKKFDALNFLKTANDSNYFFQTWERLNFFSAFHSLNNEFLQIQQEYSRKQESPHKRAEEPSQTKIDGVKQHEISFVQVKKVPGGWVNACESDR